MNPSCGLQEDRVCYQHGNLPIGADFGSLAMIRSLELPACMHDAVTFAFGQTQTRGHPTIGVDDSSAGALNTWHFFQVARNLENPDGQISW